MSSGRISCRSGTIRVRYGLLLLDADAALAQLGALDEHVGLDGPVRDPARPLLDPAGDRVLGSGEDSGHLGRRRPRRVGDQRP